MIIAIAQRDTYRFTPRLGKLILEFEATITDHEAGLTDYVKKQIVVSEDLGIKYEALDDLAIEKMALWEISNSDTGE
jgi:hypothetical protein